MKRVPFAQSLTIFSIQCFLMLSSLYASQSETEQRFILARRHYQSADFESAIQTLEEIVSDESATRDLQKRAFWLLGKCHVARNNLAEAKAAVEHVLSLEPPHFDPDFEKEPPKLLEIYYNVRSEQAGNSEVERPDPGVQIMAIVDFKNHSFIDDRGKYDPMEKGFADIMTYSMLGATDLKVVERDRVKWLIEEQNIQDKHKMEGAVRVGKLLGVHVVLMGSFIMQPNEEMFLNARLVKVETGEILLHEAEEGKFDDFLKMTQRLADKISEAAGVKGVYVPREEVPNSLAAHLAYSQGLVLLDRELYNEAYDKFKEALGHDPNFKRAEKAMERIKPLTVYYATQ